MFVIPAIPAIVVALTTVAETVLVGASIGAVVSGAACGIGGAARDLHQHGSLNSDRAINIVNDAAECATEGAIVGGAMGGVGLVVAPVAASALGVVDDVAKPVIDAADDVARPVISVIDDTVSPAISKVGNAVKSVGTGAASVFKWTKNVFNARIFKQLPKGSGNTGYVYVMDDVSTAGRYKIGKSIEPSRRIDEVQKTVGSKIDFTCIISTNNMSKLEGTLHKQFAGQRIPNFGAGTEWFKLNSVQLAAACSR